MTLTPPISTDLDAHRVPAAPARGALRPLGLDEVAITGGFWHRRQEVNGSATLEHIEHWLERDGWLGNFDRAADGTLTAANRCGREFSDSETFKYLEGLAWELGRRGGDAALEVRFQRVVKRVAAAQEPDGYLNTNFGRPTQEPRWSDLEWGHELYNLGHLFQAAVARGRTSGVEGDLLIEVARRAADLVCSVFGPDGDQRVCGHAEIESGLAELGRLLDEPAYLEQSRLFVERRGNHVLQDIEFGRAYFQDEVPIRDADALHGHAVRANYLAAGAVDVAVDLEDPSLLQALREQWQRTIERRTYVTGGQGSHHQDEAFGEDWELPSDRAYSETCAGIASIYFTWRLLLADSGARYGDLIERTLFNVVETSPAEDGRSFYYANTLHQRTPGDEADPDTISPRAHSSLRAPWFEVSCCPPNTARTFASLAAYTTTATSDGVQLHQYATSSIDTRLGDGAPVALDVETDYPRSGDVRIRVRHSPAEAWSLSLRIPAWAEGATVTIRSADGSEERQDARPGMFSTRRVFAEGDVVELALPLVARFTLPDRRVDAIRGCVAVERGPEVLALESTDLQGTELSGSDFADLTVDTASGIREEGDRVAVRIEDAASGSAAWVPLVRYHAWAQRGPSRMRVWVPVSPAR